MKTSELAKAVGVKVETVLFYEKAGLLPQPSRTGSNYRDYAPSHVARLSFIRRARDLGFGLQSVRELLTLADDKEQPCEAIDAIASEKLREVKRKIADLRSLQAELSHIAGQCKHGSVSDCKIIEALGGVGNQQLP
jgi:DNA-binding transcriptional MerR regulator